MLRSYPADRMVGFSWSSLQYLIYLLLNLTAQHIGEILISQSGSFSLKFKREMSVYVCSGGQNLRSGPSCPTEIKS